MSILVFEHAKHEGPAVLGTTLQGYGHRLRSVKLYAGDTVPADLDDVDGIVSMGGPMNVDQAGKYPWLEGEMQYLKAAHEAHVPIVGMCLGAQLIAAALGGQVASMSGPEIGWHPVSLAFPGMGDPILSGLGWETVQFHIHGQEVTQLPPGGVGLVSSPKCKIQAFKVGLTTYGFQYHPEWDRQDLESIVKDQDPFITEAGLSGQQVLQQANEFYDDYRRLGDRLCHTIAMNLFPIDKR